MATFAGLMGMLLALSFMWFSWFLLMPRSK
jgi:hypothetical protein